MNSLNAVLGARFAACVFSQAVAPATQLAGGSKAQAHCLALESSPLDHSCTREIRANVFCSFSLLRQEINYDRALRRNGPRAQPIFG